MVAQLGPLSRSAEGGGGRTDTTGNGGQAGGGERGSGWMVYVCEQEES